MSNVKFLIILIGLVSCHKGNDYYTQPSEVVEVPVEKVVEVPGETQIVETEKVVEVEKEVITYVSQDFEGIWSCSNNSFIELYVDSSDRVYVESFQQDLNSINPKSLNNNDYTNHPSFDVERLIRNNNKVVYKTNFRYSSGHNLRKDSNNDVITGEKGTEYIFSLDENKNLKIEIRVYDKKINENNKTRLVRRRLVCN